MFRHFKYCSIALFDESKIKFVFMPSLCLGRLLLSTHLAKKTPSKILKSGNVKDACLQVSLTIQSNNAQEK